MHDSVQTSLCNKLTLRVMGTGTLVHSLGPMNLSVCHEAHIYIEGWLPFHIKCSRNCQ